MKKLILTSITAMAIACPAIATTDIAVGTNPASCTEPVLGTTSGESNLQAKWTANTLNLQWISDADANYAPSNSAANTCTYDGGITVPTNNPSKTGYTFAGWKVKAGAPQCDLSGLSDTATNGKANGYSQFTNTEGSNEATYGLTQGGGEWAAEFYHGIAKGMARCSTVGNGYSEGQTGNPTDDLNQEGASYCWCQMTSYTPKTWTYDTGDASTSPIYLTGYTNQSQCKTAIRAITGLNSTNANTLLNNASGENPQLITNATGANVAYLTDSGCTTSGGASVHFGEMGNECPVSSRWVFYIAYASAANCALGCARSCASDVRYNAGFRAAVFGAVAQ